MGVPATHKSATKEDWGEDKDSDWLMEPSIVLHCATLKKSIKSLPQLLQKVELSSTFWVLLSVFYFLKRLLKQWNCEKCCLSKLHLAIFGATCITTKLQEKLLSRDVTLGNFQCNLYHNKIAREVAALGRYTWQFWCNLYHKIVRQVSGKIA